MSNLTAEQTNRYQSEINRLMTNPKFSAWYNEQSEEMKQKVMRQLTQDYEGMGDIIGDQMAEAAALRGTALPQGQMVGDRYVAANPLSIAASAWKQKKGHDRMKLAKEAKQGLSDDKSHAVGKLMQTQMPQISQDQMQQLMQTEEYKMMEQKVIQGLNDGSAFMETA